MEWSNELGKIIGTISPADLNKDLSIYEKKRRICVVTGTRAEYGLLRWIIDGIHNSSVLELQLVVTGMHLSWIWTNDKANRKRWILSIKNWNAIKLDSSVGICKSIGLGIIGFGDGLDELNPDLLLILGDRFKILAAAIGGCLLGSPVPIYMEENQQKE